MTWRKETKKCEECSKDFVAHIVSCDGIDKPSILLCPECGRKARESEEHEELLRILPQKIEDQRESWWEKCGVPPLFAGKTFGNFDSKLQPKAFDVAKNYSCQWDGDTPPLSMILLSPNLYGTGKTHLVCAIVNREIEEREAAYLSGGQIRANRCPAYFATEAALLLRIRSTYSKEDGETEEAIYRELTTDSLLVIDDVGKVRPRDYSFLQGVYFRVIDSRYVNSQPLILTTNLDYNELEEHIGGASADRLREMAGGNIVKMSGKSYRFRKGLS